MTGIDLARWLRPGDRIVIGQACGEPQLLVAALPAAAAEVAGLSAFIATSFSGALDAVAAAPIRFASIGAIGRLRSLAAAQRLDIIPCHFGQIGAFIDAGLIGCDVALVQVSPADADGNHSFGVNGDHMLAAVRAARTVIAEVNDQLPFTYGDALLPAARITHAVPVSYPPVELPPAPIGETDIAIARHAAAYIDDGAVIQTGVGAMPDAILRQLHDRRDLGIHSGMVGDALVDLVEAGVVTNARKEIDRGISIAGALMGTARLYRFAHRNAALALRGADYTHNEAVLTQLSRLVTINSALEVDLTGQVNAEASGDTYLGGAGGQIDYVRAGSRAPGGRAILALPATAQGGRRSRIVAALSGPVTTARTEVDIIVTEFGAAELKGQPLAVRAARLAAIAHPDFRAPLAAAAHAIAQRGF